MQGRNVGVLTLMRLKQYRLTLPLNVLNNYQSLIPFAQTEISGHELRYQPQMEGRY